MKNDYDVRHLHVAAFARAAGQLVGEERLARFDRLMDESKGLGGELPVRFTVHGDIRPDAAGADAVWLRLSAEADVPMTCQRCLGPVDVALAFVREFRFVATEAQAEIEDEASEEDVMAISRDFNVLELIEDELLMELPPVPKHATCPHSVKFQAVDPDYDEQVPEKINPFAVLGQLKNKH